MNLPKINKESINEFFNLSLFDKLLTGSEYFYRIIQNSANFKGKYFLELDNRKNYENLLIIVAGYQDYLYDKVLSRVNKFMENNIDVCIVTPGKKDNQLLRYCKRYGWSYLFTKKNKLSFAQNVVIKLHEKAKFIYKMDEDIFITEGFFSNLKKKYHLALKNSEFIPGAVTPVLNINGFSYSFFLDRIGKKQEYSKLFGPIKQEVCQKGENIRYSGNVAKYIWENTLPIDKIQKKYFKDINISELYIANAVRYSIGCFMFTRKVWENMGGFDVAWEGCLGKEEMQYLSYSINQSRPIILCENCLCGHFSFGPQKQEMKKFFEDNKDLF